MPMGPLSALAALAASPLRLDVSAFAARQIAGFNDGAFSDRLEKVWGTIRDGRPESIEEEMARFRAKFSPENLAGANAQVGRAVYAKTCGVCHALFGSESNGVGPEITGANRGSLDYLLENILDPSAVVGIDYQLTIVKSRDGQVVAQRHGPQL